MERVALNIIEQVIGIKKRAIAITFLLVLSFILYQLISDFILLISFWIKEE